MKFLGLIFCLISLAHAGTGEFKLFLKGITGRSSYHTRDIYVYLPSGYQTNGKNRYPVLYMHDGQNLFDPARAAYGETWNVTETLNRLIASKIIPPIIVVGVDNTPDRMHEYTHAWESSYSAGGRAQQYLEYLTYDLKRYIDHVFRTRPEPEHTGLMGSSLGGLVSVYGGARFSEVFGLIGAMSPSVWWNNKSILDIVRTSPLPLRVYVDSGTDKGERPADAELLANTFRELGATEVLFVLQQGATHNEKYWAERLPKALEFLFSPY